MAIQVSCRYGKRNAHKTKTVQFSVVELLNQIKSNPQSLFSEPDKLQLEDVEEALLYLSKIGALKLEGGFLILYNAMNIQRIKDNKSRYKQDDYRMLNEFYKQKIQQVHIVGEYANLMVKDYNAALQYVQDYFQMELKKFVAKYFKGERVSEIQAQPDSSEIQAIVRSTIQTSNGNYFRQGIALHRCCSRSRQWKNTRTGP